nr:hypothetical protein [uncultured Anaerocolumna sp.]
MRRNILSFTSKTITGEIGKILAAGDVNISNADVEKLTGAGDVNIESSYIAETKLAGDLTASDSSFGNLNMAGEVRLLGNCKGDTLIIIGKLEAESLEARILRNFSVKNNVKIYGNIDKDVNIDFNNNWGLNINQKEYRKEKVNIQFNLGSKNKKFQYGRNEIDHMEDSIYKGKIKAETFENLCDFHLNFAYEFKNILSIGSLHGEGVLECEELYSFGNINMEEINAEVVYIHPDSRSKVKQVMGSDIRITESFLMDQTFLSLPKSADNKIYKKEASKSATIMELDSIEGDDIVLDHVHAKRVSGDHVVIGDHCVIDCVEYKNNIEISSKSVVKNKIKI